MKKPAKPDNVFFGPHPPHRVSATKDANPRLTLRERQVLELMAEGYTSEQIGLHLGLSSRTVEFYREELRRKSGAMNTVLILRYFFEFIPKGDIPQCAGH